MGELIPEINKKYNVSIYHYCSAETLESILRAKTIRFTDIGKLNDSLEREWAYDVCKEIIERELSDKYPDLAEIIEIRCAQFKENFRSLVSCYSKKSDVLSQWRAYADDGRGFCIGIKIDAFKLSPAWLYEVVYGKKQQQRLIYSHLMKVVDLYKKDPDSYVNGKLPHDVYDMCNDFVLMKNPAFREELEVRGVILTKLFGKGGGKIPPTYYNTEQDKDMPVSYQIRDGHIRPYLDWKSIPDLPLTEIVIGPRNPNSVQEVKWLADSHGFSKVKVRLSSASYR